MYLVICQGSNGYPESYFEKSIALCRTGEEALRCSALLREWIAQYPKEWVHRIDKDDWALKNPCPVATQELNMYLGYSDIRVTQYAVDFWEEGEVLTGAGI